MTDVTPEDYVRPAPNQWVTPEHAEYRMECCDCGLVHAVDFQVVDAEGRTIEGAHVQFRMRRDPEQSLARRRVRFPQFMGVRSE